MKRSTPESLWRTGGSNYVLRHKDSGVERFIILEVFMPLRCKMRKWRQWRKRSVKQVVGENMLCLRHICWTYCIKLFWPSKPLATLWESCMLSELYHAIHVGAHLHLMLC